MSISYEGIGEWCATFVCGAVSEGDIVKVSANGTVGKCTAGDGFCGLKNRRITERRVENTLFFFYVKCYSMKYTNNI